MRLECKLLLRVVDVDSEPYTLFCFVLIDSEVRTLLCSRNSNSGPLLPDCVLG